MRNWLYVGGDQRNTKYFGKLYLGGKRRIVGNSGFPELRRRLVIYRCLRFADVCFAAKAGSFMFTGFNYQKWSS